MGEILFSAYFKVDRHGIKKNSKQIRFNRKTGQRFITSSDNSKLSEAWLLRYLHLEKLKQKIDKPIDFDITAKFIFFFPKSVYYTKKNVRSKTIGDLDNLVTLPMDCLQKAEIIETDSLVCSLDGSRRMPIEGSDYFIKIELSRFV